LGANYAEETKVPLAHVDRGQKERAGGGECFVLAEGKKQRKEKRKEKLMLSRWGKGRP